MKEKLEFVLTPKMAGELIKFNNLKKELNNLKNKEILDNNDLIRISKLENDLVNTRIRFIKEFRDNNKEEIIKYLNSKDQFWSFFIF